MTAWSLVFLALASGHVGPPGAVRKAPLDYFPLAQGNTWRMRSPGGQREERTARVTRVTLDGTGAEATVDWSTHNGPSETEIYRTSPSGVLRVSIGTDENSRLEPPMPILHYPLVAGRRWIWRGAIRSGARIVPAHARISATGPYRIRTDAGDFSAMRVHCALVLHGEGGSRVNAPTDYWFAPGVGLVQQRAQVGSQDFESQVASYRLAQTTRLDGRGARGARPGPIRTNETERH